MNPTDSPKLALKFKSTIEPLIGTFFKALLFHFFWLFILFLIKPVWGQNSPLQDSIQWHRKNGNFLKALGFAQKWHDKIPQNAHDSVKIEALEIRADLLVRLNENKEALAVIKQWIDLLKATGADSIEFASPYNRLGTTFYNIADYPKSIEFYGKSKELRIRHYGPEHPEVARSLSNLGNVYLMIGDYRKAEELYLKTHEIRQKSLPANDPALGHSSNGLGLVYQNLGDFGKSETYFNKSLAINQARLGSDHPNVGAVFNNLGTLAELIGDYSKAEKYFLEGLRIRKKAHGDSNVLAAQNYFHLARLYEASQQWQKAESMLEIGAAIYQKEYGTGHLLTANSHFLKGELWIKKKRFDLAEAELKTARKIWEKAFGTVSLKVGKVDFGLARLNNEKGAHDKALGLLKTSYAIHKKHLGIKHPDLGFLQYQIGFTYLEMAREDSAYKWYQLAVAHYQDQIARLFPVLSEREKEKYYYLASRVFKEYFALAALRYSSHPEVAGDLYNLVLATKALLLNNSAKWKQKIRGSGDRKLMQLYTVWESNQNLISKLITTKDSTVSDSLTRLSEKNEKLEKELSTRYKDFYTLTERKSYHWREVAQKLKPNEAAIEMVRMNPWGQISTQKNIKETAHLIEKAKMLLDIPVYVALVLRYGDKQPKMIWLPDGQNLEGRNFNYYQNSIRKKMADSISYDLFWKPLALATGQAIKRIYFSPDGVYHFINPATLLNNRTGIYLLEEKDIRLVTVTNDLLEKKQVVPSNKLAYLFGNPVFASSPVSLDSNQTRGSFSFPFLQKMSLPELPGTKTELKFIANQLIENGWEVVTFSQAEATEEKVKDIFTPRVLHLATHGYFIHDSTLNPLVCSGLFLANPKKSEKENLTPEDGILTAYEAMNLNLDNTDLVVLSACETGLGEVKNGEGVYGLQRAFKVAGARSLIMSLWKVDDVATQELMVSFYKNWLSSPNGTKRAAFLKAQKELKAKYPQPYFWGAFVLVGE